MVCGGGGIDEGFIRNCCIRGRNYVFHNSVNDDMSADFNSSMKY